MIPSMNIERYNGLENQFYDYFSQVEKHFKNPSGFISFLTEQSGYFDLPATTHANCNYKGGFLEHSLNVTKILVDLNYFIANKKYTLEQCIIHGLFNNLHFAYHKGYFPFIYDLDKYWIWNENVDLSEVYSLSETISDHVNEFDTGVKFRVLLNWAEQWTSMHEPFISYRKLESEELILQDNYL